MKTKENKQKKAKKVINIVLDVFCVLIFLFAVYGLVIKFTNNSLYLFGTRSDVVLTESMSFVNEDPKVKKFLDGHTDQLKKGDLVYSTKVKEDTELNVYDIVIFKSYDTGKETIHRIVDIKDGSLYLDGKERYVIRADTANYGSHDGAYPRDKIIAKYKSHVHGLGNIVRFFRSIFGIILEVGLIAIVLLYQYFDDRFYGSKLVEQQSGSNKEKTPKKIKPAKSKVKTVKSSSKPGKKPEKYEEKVSNKTNASNNVVRSSETGRFVSTKKK